MLPLLALLSAPAHATWTIVAVDPETGAVGAAGATCARWVWVVASVVPDSGAVVAQSVTNRDARDQAAGMLGDGQLPQDIIDEITTGDDELADRQYGVASLNGPAAHFTGADNWDWAGAQAGDWFSVQGNSLTGAAVVDDASAAYLAAEGEELGERLLQALEAGAAQGGDERCDADKAAKSAFLIVAEPGDEADAPSVELRATDGCGGGAAVDELRVSWDDGETHARCSTTGRAGGWGFALLLVALRRRRG